MQPGQCWAFKGTQGYLVLELAFKVLPYAFSIEHIPKSLSPAGEIDSAPREVSVWVSGIYVTYLGVFQVYYIHLLKSKAKR